MRYACLRSVRALIRPTSACRHILLPCSCCINTRTCNSTSVHDSARPLWPYTFVHELENDASTRAHLLACAHACETLCCGFLARKPEVSSLVWPARRASARLRTPLRGTNFESGSLARAFQRKHDYVHDAGALYTGYVHARFIHAVYRSVGADVCFMRACGARRPRLRRGIFYYFPPAWLISQFGLPECGGGIFSCIFCSDLLIKFTRDRSLS